jgi:hypothetical protein
LGGLVRVERKSSGGLGSWGNARLEMVLGVK